MAGVKFIFAYLFLAVLIFSQEIQSIEGRQLNSGMKKGSLKLETHGKILTKCDEHNENEYQPAIPPTPAVAKSQPPPSGRVETVE